MLLFAKEWILPRWVWILPYELSFIRANKNQDFNFHFVSPAYMKMYESVPAEDLKKFLIKFINFLISVLKEIGPILKEYGKVDNAIIHDFFSLVKLAKTNQIETQAGRDTSGETGIWCKETFTQ